MDTRTLGPFEVSVVGLDCNNFSGRVDSKATGAVVNAALDAGITLYDTADIYSEGKSEEYLGKALGSRRDEVVVASKFGMEMPDGSGGSPAWVRQAANPAVASVIAGATRVKQIAANAAAASWVLSSDEAAKARDLTA